MEKNHSFILWNFDQKFLELNKLFPPEVILPVKLLNNSYSLNF